MIDYSKAKNFQQRRKINIVYVLGGKCSVCGYNKCIQALDAHHINPEEKELTLSENHNIATIKILEELKKCTLLCANCHREYHAGELEVELCSTYDENKAQEVLELIEASKHKQLHYCKECGKQITKGATYCVECGEKSRRVVERPAREELKDLIRNLPFTTIAKQYGVTDNAVRKWCDKYDLPRTKSEIKQYSDEQWATV